MMMWHSRNTSPPAEHPGACNRVLAPVALLLVLFALSVRPDSVTRTAFSLTGDGITDSNLVATVNGAGLGVERKAVIKLLGDSFPEFSSRSMYADVAVAATDSFQFFCVDTTMRKVVSQGVRLLPDGIAVMGTFGKMCDISPVQDCYLHVDRGSDGFLASYVQKGSSAKRYLQVSTGTASRNIDSAATSGWLFSSQSLFAGDTFLVISSADMNRVNLRKIYARGTVIEVVSSVTVATGTATAGNYVMNCSVAADSTGAIMATWVKGSPYNVKYFHYRFFAPDLTPGPADSYGQPVSKTDDFSYYDDIAVTAFGPGHFAAVSWDGAGVLLHHLHLNGSSVTPDVSRIIGKSGLSYCTVASNGRYMVIAASGDVDGNGTPGIEGVTFKISNYTPGTPETVSFSLPGDSVIITDGFSTALNAAIDDSGTFALTWRNREKAAGCIWAHRGIRHRTGFYTSPVESLGTGADSIQFSPVEVTLSGTASWHTVDSLRTGNTPAACIAAPWISFSDQAVLRNNRTRNRYYQYRTALERNTWGTIDSFTTPGIRSVTVRWNAQPGIDAVDSVVTSAAVRRSPSFGDTVTLRSRSDSAQVWLHAHDPDNGESVTITPSMVSTPANRTLGGGPDFSTVFTVLPLQASETTVPCTLSIADAAAWQGMPRVFFIRTRNSRPQLRLRALLRDGTVRTDTMEAGSDTAMAVQVEDTVELFCTVADSNDAATVRGYVEMHDGAEYRRLDSAATGLPLVFTILGDTAAPADTIRFRATSVDPDTAVVRRFGLVVNHPPRLRSVTIAGDTLEAGDTADVILDDTVSLIVSVNDTDSYSGDTLFLRTRFIERADSLRTTATACTLHLVPDVNDTLVRLVVSDRFNRADSMYLRLAYPWYSTDTVENPGYAEGKRGLAQGPSLIAGAGTGDTITVPLLNGGRDRLLITGCLFARPDLQWLRVDLAGGDTLFTLNPSESLFVRAVTIEPDSTASLSFHFNAKSLAGDTVVYTEVVLFTNDPRHRADTFHICLEYNDLPRIVAVAPSFIADRPYRRPAKRMAYTFPPHASIAVAFTEPMDSASVTAAVSVYSIRDAQVSGRITPIPLEYEWLQGGTVVHLTPHYDTASSAFGLLPPDGLFIPTDSLRLVVTSGCVDRASTPSGPNTLDVNQDFRRDDGTDTSFALQVDRIDFTVLSVDPQPGNDGVARIPRITVHFSSPVYAASVDTSLHGNRSLAVTSRYGEGDTVPFQSVRVDTSSVAFTVASEFFYRDSLTCRYSSRWVYDRMGFATDNNGDGIDATLFDTAAEDDNLEWGYRIKTIAVSSVAPDSNSVNTDVSPLITIRFDDRLSPGTIDMDTSPDNRSFRIGSTRTGWSSFSRVAVADDSMSVQLRPRVSFFSNDSVFCRFNGFPAEYRYRRASNFPDSGSAVFGSYEWFFESGEIGFYTYPNPYKPGTDPRHCSNRGPCGIWFKNLHTLGNGFDEVTITVFSQTAHPVFDSRKAGKTIRFGTGKGEDLPQWLWDTRNNRGELVATGLYLYAVFGTDSRVLQKGKLIIVR